MPWTNGTIIVSPVVITLLGVLAISEPSVRVIAIGLIAMTTTLFVTAIAHRVEINKKEKP